MAWPKTILAVGLAGAAAVIALQWRQNSTTDRNLKQLQDQVRQQADEIQTQKTDLVKSEAQRVFYAKKIEEMNHDVAKARAHASAALAKANVASRAASPSGGLDSKSLLAMMNDPAMVKMMKTQAEGSLKMQYGDFVKQAKLSPEQTDKFYALLLDDQMTNMTRGMGMMSGQNPADIKAQTADQQQQLASDLQAVLGDGAYKDYQDYAKTVADRTELSLLKSQFGDNPLSNDQQQQLLQAMTTARQTVSGGTTPDLTDMSSPDRLVAAQKLYMDQQEQINQQVLTQAASFLSADQVQALGSSQSNFLNMQKVGMEMAQKMFPGASNSAAGQ